MCTPLLLRTIRRLYSLKRNRNGEFALDSEKQFPSFRMLTRGGGWHRASFATSKFIFCKNSRIKCKYHHEIKLTFFSFFSSSFRYFFFLLKILRITSRWLNNTHTFHGILVITPKEETTYCVVYSCSRARKKKRKEERTCT